MQDAEFVAAYAEFQHEMAQIAESIASETAMSDRAALNKMSRD